MIKIFLSLLFMFIIWRRLNWWVLIYLIVFIMVYLLFQTPLIERIKIVGMDFYVDSLSFRLCYLSIWLTILILFARNSLIKYKTYINLYSYLIYFLLTVLLIRFLISNYLMFYFFFETSLIPTLLIIMGWGYQPERLQAGLYLIVYTLVASLPLLVSLFYLNYIIGSIRMFIDLLNLIITNKVTRIILIILIVLAFIVKLPIYLVHLWLPKAHVEAPVAGSIILAGVLLKLGGYGICRILIKNLLGNLLVSRIFISLSLIGIIFVGLICCRLNDIKALVAYSSVAHIGLVLCGLLTGFFYGLQGAFIIIIRHGLSSSGLFCIVNIYYERTGSRSIYVNKGLLLIFPIFSLILFLLCASNISAPPTINLMSEIYLILRVLYFDYFIMIVFPLGSFLGAIFTLYLFSLRQHGKFFSNNLNFCPNKFREIHVLGLHLVPLNILVLKPELFFLWL